LRVKENENENGNYFAGARSIKGKE
jgi:hypothetical protein